MRLHSSSPALHTVEQHGQTSWKSVTGKQISIKILWERMEWALGRISGLGSKLLIAPTNVWLGSECSVERPCELNPPTLPPNIAYPKTHTPDVPTPSPTSLYNFSNPSPKQLSHIHCCQYRHETSTLDPSSSRRQAAPGQCWSRCDVKTRRSMGQARRTRTPTKLSFSFLLDTTSTHESTAIHTLSLNSLAVIFEDLLTRGLHEARNWGEKGQKLESMQVKDEDKRKAMREFLQDWSNITSRIGGISGGSAGFRARLTGP